MSSTMLPQSATDHSLDADALIRTLVDSKIHLETNLMLGVRMVYIYISDFAHEN